MPNDALDTALAPHLIAVGDLNGADKNGFEIAPDATERRAIAAFLGVRQIKKLRFSGDLQARGATDWRLSATLGASVVQDCVITGAPVATRIDSICHRFFCRDAAKPEEEGDHEFDGDIESEPLGSVIDLGQTMIESLALELPDYPRSENAELTDSVFSPPETAPLQDSDMKPFASLAKLRDKISK